LSVNQPRPRWQSLAPRLLIGSLLLLLAVAVLVFDRYWAPWYPFLAVTTIGFGWLASRELRQIFPEPRPPGWWMDGGVIAVLLANWIPQGLALPSGWGGSATVVLLVTALVLLVGFLAEMARFVGKEGAIQRLALGALALVWLGVAPGFLLRLRWLGDETATGIASASDLGLWALAFGIFVPKVGDMAAYFGGSWLGRHQLAPVLSPKKTWEGALAGLVGSILIGLAIAEMCRYHTGQPLLSWPVALVSAAVVGIVAQYSDLAESLVKRERQVKDTSSYMPGLGGVLDVVDSLLLSAPVSWLALSIGRQL
jgi:phosphatidate cytidylyltransferase